MPDEDGARRAAEAIIDAFARHDREAYFAAFALDATFLFHNHGERLGARADYEALWRAWEADGFRVVSCVSRGAAVQMVTEDVAVFTHRVETTLAGAEDSPLHERETIVVRRGADGRWLGVHEHLSPAPVVAKTEGRPVA